MGMHKHCPYPVPTSKWWALRGLCARIDSHSAGIVGTCVTGETNTDAGEIVEVTFEEVNPGPGKDYMYHPTIKTFLEETSLDPYVSDKRSGWIIADPWFGCGTFLCSDPLQAETCAGPQGPEAAASSIVQVDVLVHSSQSIRRVTLDAWMNSAQNPQIAKFEWETVKTRKGKSYRRLPTVQQFLEGSELTAPAADKRLLVDLAGPSGLSPKKCG
jgi:hypothetical protein